MRNLTADEGGLAPPCDFSEAMLDLAMESIWNAGFTLISIEDGLWEEWPRLHSALGISPLTLGDDFLCTHPERIQRAVQCQACNALLLKVNQIGTLTEAAQALGLARTRGGP